MKNKLLKKTSIVAFLLSSIISYSQQIGDGFAPITPDFGAPLKSGVYNGKNPIGSTPDSSNPWQHLFVSRHLDQNNNHQLQIASSITVNDRLFFRKIAASTLITSNSTWVELATRGTNTFIGDQYLSGNQSVTGNLFLGQHGEIGTISGPGNSGAIQIKTNINYAGSNNRYLRLGWKDNNGIFSPSLSINEDLNVGIGTINPTSKLTVAGNIQSREVKVTVNAGADFVFEKNYNLPSLDSVDKFIKENKHLRK
ncbi:hypothetical protein [Flavobacterium anhuiense]|uniref:hypothetical protein n=1 Tax=Flavobacterium anhuiense TaxID=459526 RepID=UPI000E6D002F|nr:hypothetical protein [Flavobacterium anhuiense]